MKRQPRPSASIVLVPIGLSLLATMALAQPGQNETDLPRSTITDEIVVSATGFEVARRLVGSSVTVIDRQEIESRDKVTIKELLRTVPGIEVAQTGGAGGATSVFIRGAGSSSSLVLIDGIRVNNPAGGGFDFADLTTDGIERIEVLRGAQSALYGSEAMGGVISIFTRRGAEALAYNLRAEGGSEGYARFRGGVEGSAATGAIDYSVVGSRQQTDGVSQASENDGNSERDRWENTTATASIGGDFADDGRADVSLRAFDAVAGLDGFSFVTGGPVDDPNALQQSSGVFASANVAKNITPIWRQSLRIGVTDTTLEGIDPDTFFSNFKIDSKLTEADLKADLKPIPNDTITAGYTYQKQEGVNRDTFSADTDLSSFYLQNQWIHEETLSVVLGLRNDDHSTFGSETTYRGAVSYALPSATRVHASIGTGFRAPTFNDLFFPGFGNPDLRPETSDSWDLGIAQTWQGDRLSLDITYFDNRFQDLIGFGPDFTAINIDEATANGIEGSFSWLISKTLRWDNGYTWTDATDTTTGQQLARRPRQRFTTTFFCQPTRNWQGTATVIAVRDRTDSDGSAMDDYERLDVNVSYTIGEDLRMGFRLLNLLDQNYEEISGFTTPGRQIALTIGYGR